MTTAVGLAVAIPVVAVHAWLDRCVERVAHDMDSIVTQVFTVDLSGGPVGAAVHSNPNLTASYATGS